MRFAKEYQLREGKRISAELSKDETKFYSFSVPDDADIHSISVELGIFGNSNKVRMFATIAKDENTVPDNLNTIPVLPSWFGLSARAYEGNQGEFCRNCKYKVMVSSNEKMSFTLLYHTNKQVVKAKEKYFSTYEIVHYGERNCYQYSVEESDDILEVSINTFNGDPNIYVNPATLPQSKGDFAFKTSGDLDEILTIDPRQRKEHNAVTGNYYVCIYGELSSSYALFISTYEKNSGVMEYLNPGLTRTAEVRKDQLKVFEYGLIKSEKANITFTLTSLTGNADLYIVMCVQNLDDYGVPLNECVLDKDRLSAKEVFKSELTSSVDVITFKFDPQECSDPRKYCSYLVGVLGKTYAKFTLTATDSEDAEEHLIEGRPLYGYVSHKRNMYYTFVVSDPETASIRIQLTSLSGDADLFANRLRRGDRTESEQFSNNVAYMPDTITFTKKDHGLLNASYHITVYGETAATYTIIYTTDAPKKRDKAILLTDGIPQTIVVSDAAGELCYFHAPSTRQNLRIQVTPLAGTLAVYIGANFIPTEHNHTWAITQFDRDIEILDNDPSYVANGKYYILLHKKEKEDTVPCIASVKFASGTFHTTVVESQPELGNLSQGETRYYRYNVVSSAGSITILVTPFSGDPDLYISLSSSNDKPDLDNRDYAALAVGADYIRIPVADILAKNPSCTTSHFASIDCSIYIGVKCASENCKYNLQIGRSSEFIMNLLDGYPQFGVAFPNDPQYYVYRPGVVENNTVLSIYSKKENVHAFLSLASESQRNQLKPNSTHHDLKTHNRANMAMLIIPKERNKECGSYCRYYIGVYTDAVPSDTKESEFTITVSSNVRQLVEGQTIVDYVDSRMYRYYRFDAPYDNCTFSVSVTPLSTGDPDLFVNRGGARLPNKDAADFKSFSYRGDLLQIPVTDTARRPWRRSFLIAVYGSQNSTYSITATTSASIIHEVNQGVPMRQEQKARSINYFLFRSWKKAEIVVSLAMHSGRATIRANVVENMREINVLDSLPSTESKSTWSSLRKNTLNYLNIAENDANYKEEGNYLIGVETDEGSSYDITVDYESSEDFKLLKLYEGLRVTLNANAQKRYKFELDNFEDVTIRVNAFYGSVDGSVATAKEGSAQWTFKENKGVTIKASDRNFVIGTYYMTLTAKSSADFVVTVEFEQEPLWLAEGLPLTAELKANKPTHFYFSIPKNVEGVGVNIYVSLPEKSNLNPSMYVRRIDRSNGTMPSKSLFDYRAYWDPDLKQLGTTFVTNTLFSTTLAVTVTSDIGTGSFVITAWTSGLALLALDNLYSNTFSHGDDAHVYQLSLPKTSRIYIEVIPCLGEVEFFVSKNMANVNDRKYDLKKTELSKGKLFGSLEKPEGIYYVSVRAANFPEKGKQIRYTIRTFQSSAESLPNLEDYILSDYGNIKISYENNKVSLSWGTPYLRSSKLIMKANATYSVYMSTDGEENMYTICGIKYGNAERILSGLSTTKAEYTMKKPKMNSKYVFNVLATMHDVNNTVAYNPVSLQLSRGQPRRFGRVIPIVAVVLVVLLAAVAIYFWRKYKAAMKELHYEMNDVRNLGNISAGREMPAERAETYLHLRSGGEE